MRLRPLSDQVLVRPLDLDRVSKGGIHIPDQVRSNQKEREKSLEGVVVAAGPGARIGGPEVKDDNGVKYQDDVEREGTAFHDGHGWRRSMEVKPGDRIVFRNFQYSQVRIEGELLLVMNEGDMLAVYEE